MRTITVKNQNEYEKLVTGLIVAGYRRGTGKEDGYPTDAFIKRDRAKVSTGILWFVLGVLPLIIYLIYIALKAPADEVTIEIEGQPKKENSKETKQETPKEAPKEGEEKTEEKEETLWQYLTRDD